MKIGIIGLGYVGLPLCLQFGRTGSAVIGIDIDEKKVNSINRGESYIKHIRHSDILSLVKDNCFRATTNMAEASGCDAILICVPTPLNKHREPDLKYVFSTGENLAPFITDEMVVILESTIYPGATEEDLRKILERGSRKKAGTDFYLAYSPERESPGNLDNQISKIPKVVGGFTPRCQRKAESIYKSAIETIIPVSSCRAAEATKLLENIFRSVNIALVNELKIIYNQMGIDIWEVIEAAKTKPFGYEAFYPGPGLGGHCIPIDPFYLTWKARQYGISTRFIELAGEVNLSMPSYVFRRTVDALNQKGKALRGAKILILGLAYKEEVDDDRESPSYKLMEMFLNMLAVVDYYDPYIPLIRPRRGSDLLSGQKSICWSQETIMQYDAVVISTAHQKINYKDLTAWANCIVDTRNIMKTQEVKEGQLIKA